MRMYKTWNEKTVPEMRGALLGNISDKRLVLMFNPFGSPAF